jgi:hypothetical protein
MCLSASLSLTMGYLTSSPGQTLEKEDIAPNLPTLTKKEIRLARLTSSPP